MDRTSASSRSSRTDDVEAGALTRGGSGSGSGLLEPLPEWMSVLNRVPPQLRKNKKHVYDPSVISLGPYHHGLPHLRHLEEFKEKLASIILKDEERRRLFHGEILGRIDDVRHFYGGLSREEHGDDEALASMILRDACLLLYTLELAAEKEGIEEEGDGDGDEEREEKLMLLVRYMGLFQGALMVSDCMKLENQIPWWVLTSLLSVEDDQRDLIRRFLSFQTYGNFTQLEQLLWEDGDDDQPLHLLDALRTTVIINQAVVRNAGQYLEKTIRSTVDEVENTSDRLQSPPPCPAFCWTWWGRRRRKSSPYSMLHPGRRPFRTVTELRAKGVHFRPSSTNFLLDINFTSYYFFAVLRLPVLAVQQKDTEVVFSNMVALEMCPGSQCLDAIVTSYLTLMKSMIERAEDVKELQEKGVVLSFGEDNEEIVRMLKGMDSCSGLELLPVFDELKMRINRHCSSKARTWIADLINTYFRSPWTATALAAAALLLCLTFMQTYFTINPRA